MTTQPIAWSLAQMLLAGLRETEKGARRDEILGELAVTLEHIGPNVADLTPRDAALALQRTGLDASEMAGAAIAAGFPKRQNHVVTINDSGGRAYPHRVECSCGMRGVWHADRDRAVMAGQRHVGLAR